MLGPWADESACIQDPGLVKRVPNAADRHRICIKLKQRATPTLGPKGADEGSFTGKVTEGERYWIVHDAIAAREGVNSRGEYKPWDELVKAADSLEGVPLLYGAHPTDENGSYIVSPDPLAGVGHAINVRAQDSDHTLRYDALLFKEVPAGYSTPANQVAKNSILVDLVTRGETVDNSVGYTLTAYAQPGVYTRDGDTREYREVQRNLGFGHVALLKPIEPYNGACSAAMGCGIGVDHDACKGGDGCCRKRAESEARKIMDAHGVTRAAAMRILATSMR